ncbi:MAG TPA: DUF2007 domain-containing protein [Bacteroidales bacterium]|jgi:hypothetical protein|nr:DUF2007 domain-containing protein [Bacteroidales bacterium]
MFDNWVVIYSSDQLYEVEMVRNYLNDHGIECVVMNKKDSAYMFGDIEVYVPTEEAFSAKQLILDFKSE